MSNVECIHGLDLALCDSCTPQKLPEPVDAAPVKRASRATAPRAGVSKAGGSASSLRSAADHRVYVVLSIDELADVLAEGMLVDPIYYLGPEELAWGERRRATDVLEQTVLVLGRAAVESRHAVFAGEVPMTNVQLIAVANIVVQDRVRELLALTDYGTKVAVYPPWFQA